MGVASALCGKWTGAGCKQMQWIYLDLKLVNLSRSNLIKDSSGECLIKSVGSSSNPIGVQILD